MIWAYVGLAILLVLIVVSGIWLIYQHRALSNANSLKKQELQSIESKITEGRAELAEALEKSRKLHENESALENSLASLTTEIQDSQYELTNIKMNLDDASQALAITKANDSILKEGYAEKQSILEQGYTEKQTILEQGYLDRQHKIETDLVNLALEYKSKEKELESEYQEKRRQLKAEMEDTMRQWQSDIDSQDAAHDANERVRKAQLEAAFEKRIEVLEADYKAKTEQAEFLFSEATTKLQDEYNLLVEKVDEQRRILLIALEQNRQDNEDDSRHYLAISGVDQREIEELAGVCQHIRNPLPLCKAVYDIYYKVPYTNLVNDLQVRGVCGIYKITDTSCGKIYIGQSVDIGERWKQHLKRGCGADVGTISGSKLYSAMSKNGLWNFKFEVLQECGKEDLNKYEKYWINYFNSVELGYNMRAGG